MKNKGNNIFRLLAKNALRILKNSKILMLQLGILLSIGIIVIVTIFSSTFLLSQSKNKIINKGNLANLTVSIPTNKLKESISNSNTDGSDSSASPDKTNVNLYNGGTPADIQLQEYLKSQNYEYIFSKNLSLSDITTGNSFLLSLANQKNISDPNPINELIANNTLPASVHDAEDSELTSTSKFFWLLRDLGMVTNDENTSEVVQVFEYDNYIKNKPWALASMLCNSVWNLPENTTKEIISILQKITVVPANQNDYINNYYPFIGVPTTASAIRYNTNSYFYQLNQKFSVNRIMYNGYGYSMLGTQVIPLIGVGGDIPFQMEYNDKSAYFSIISSSYIDANKDTKSILDRRTIIDAMALPYKSNFSNGNSINPNEGYKVYNQDKGISENQVDFLTWFNNLDSKYKVSINSLTYLIAGVGDAPNLLYPVQSATQLLVNAKTNGVAYVNNLGFSRALDGTSYEPTVYYSVRYPPSSTILSRPQLLSDLKKWTENNYETETAYLLSDAKQPNRLFYVWANFLNNLQYIITTIGGIIGGIVVILGLVFISLLIRSIVKLNKVTFGVGLANGVSKIKLALSFFPFALLPAIIFGTIAFFCGYLLVTPTLDIVRNYWTLTINNPVMQWWIWLVIIIATFILLYVLIIAIIFITLRHNTQTIMSSTGAFKINPLVIYTKGLTSRFRPLWSFRITFMMSNISRFIILLFSVVYIISLSAVIVGTNNLFQTSLASISENKKYFMAYDLYSPTINGGYYSAIDYNMLGTSQQGMFNSYNTNGANNYNSPNKTSGDFYTGIYYNNALTYPYGSNLYFTSLFMTNSNLANEINHNIQFMSNRLFSKLLLDVEVNALGAMLNPWEFAKQIMPESIQYLAEQNTEALVQTNFDFYLWLQEQNKIANAGDSDNYVNIQGIDNSEYSQFNNKPINYKTYLPNVIGQPFTLDSSDIVADYNDANNKNKWIFIPQVNNLTGKTRWVINQDYVINGAPSYTIKAPAAQLIVQFMTNNQNPLFRFWYMFCYDKNPNKGQLDQIIPDYNYKMSSSAVPVNSNDETYTYLTSSFRRKNSTSTNIKINGIQPNSKLVYLYDSYGNDLKTKLSQFTTSIEEVKNEDGTTTVYQLYPLVINNVVAKKYNLSTGQKIIVDTKNTFDRFNLINIGETPSYTTMFQIVGVTDTNYGDELYTLQTYANQILGFTDSSGLSSSNWINNVQPGDGYTPFNGVYTTNTTLQMAKNYAGFYSPSGLSTILGNWGDNASGESVGAIQYLFLNNRATLDNKANLNLFVDRNNNNKIITKTLTEEQRFSFTIDDTSKAVEIINKVIRLFGNSSAIVTQIQNIDSPYAISQMGNSFDKVLTEIGIVTIVAMLPTLIIIIGLLAILIVFEASRLISLMKILGYTDIKNLFSFMFVYIAVWVLGTILSIPIAIAISSIIEAIAFASFSVIATPVLPWWIFVAGFGIVGAIFLGLFIFVYNKLKHINLAQEIAVK